MKASKTTRRVPGIFTPDPFSDEYCQREIDWYALKEYQVGKVHLKTKSVIGRCDDFLHINFRGESIEAPILKIDKKTWMSLTPMEIQSAFLAVRRAHGAVGTLGLGMGYFALKAAEKEEVISVDVFEREPDVIAFFNDAFRDRPGFDKIKIHEGDAHEQCLGYTFDYMFADIYPTLCEDAMLDDMEFFRDHNNITSYHFWTEEKVVLGAVVENLLGVDDLRQDERMFFATFMSDEMRRGLFRSHLDVPYIKRWKELSGRG